MKKLQEISKNIFHKTSPSNSKYLVIPDLHGVHSIYQKVEKYIKNDIEPERKIIFLGDYMDRGESGELDGEYFDDVGSYLVMRDILELQKWAKEEKRFMIFLRGNHETFYEEYLIDGNDNPYDKYDFFRDAITCLEHVFEKDSTFKESLITFLKDLHPFYLDKEMNLLFVHAGVNPKGGSLSSQAKKGTIYWIRDPFIFSPLKMKYTVIFGHTPFSKPMMKLDRIGLDSGIYQRHFINLLKIDVDMSKIIRIEK
jgi:serine/threonine protein phosphatase 1